MDSITGGVLVIANGTLIDGTGTEPRRNGAIVVRGTTIVEVHAAKPPRFDPRGTMIDATGKFILPGLIDGHVHLSMYQDAPAGITSPTTAEFCTMRAAEHLLPILRAGVTSVSVPGGKWFVDVTLRDAVKAGTLPGPRIFCSGRALTPPGGISTIAARRMATCQRKPPACCATPWKISLPRRAGSVTVASI